MNSRFIKLIALCVLSVLAIDNHAQVIINEVSATSLGPDGVTDNYNETEDFIELYNPTGAPVDIGGYFLSDDPDDPMKWEIPAGTQVPAGGYQIAWCNERDEMSGGYLHTNFRIMQCQHESAVFSDPSGNILDQYTIDLPNQHNHSWGRTSDGADTWSVFLTPTVGAPNTDPHPPYSLRPEFDTEPGFYNGSVTVSLSTTENNTSIYYTLDGTTPDETSTPYNGPINISETTVVRAVCINDDPEKPWSVVETNTYFIDEEHTVPVISISGDQIMTLLGGNQIEPLGHLELYESDGSFVAESSGEYNKHGNDSWAYDQRGLDYITQDEFGFASGLEHEIYSWKDREEYQRIILKCGANDNYPFEDGGAHIRDPYVQSLSQVSDLRMDERTYRPCILYANGEYWGLYEIREKVDDLDFTTIYYDQDWPYVDYIKTWGGTWEEYGSIDDWETLRDFILNNDMTDDANYQQVVDQFETGSLIDYFILNSYIVCADWLNWNTSWWRGRDPDGDIPRWRYTLWDMDASFDHYVNYTGIPDQSANADVCDPEEFGDPGGQGHVPIWNALLQNEDFYSDYINRFSDLSNTHFTCEALHSHLDSLINLIEPEMQRQIDRWGGSMSEWQDNVQAIHDFIDTRCQTINEGIADCYDVEGPYELTVMAEPPNGGNIDLNTIEINDFPWTGTYFGGVTLELDADDNDGYEFSHWTINNNTLLPDADTEEVELNLTSNDTVVAHFIPIITHDVTFDVEPENSGEVTVNGDLLDNYPTTLELAEQVEHDLSATPYDGYYFDYWELENHVVLPASTDMEVVLELAQGDNVTAHFAETIFDVTFDVVPDIDATITIDGQVIDQFPTTLTLQGEADLEMSTATGLEYYEFSGWNTLNAAPTPDNTTQEVTINFSGNDQVVANYYEIPNHEVTFLVKPEGSGRVVFSDKLISSFPYTDRFLGNEALPLEALPRNEYKFNRWEVAIHEVVPSETSIAGSLNLHLPDTVIAHFDKRYNNVFIPNSFTPNGDGLNDLLKVYGTEISEEDYHLRIINRFGETVYESNSIDEGWNGTLMDSNYMVPSGVYIFQLEYVDKITGDNKQKQGHITVIR